ncbi:MAG: hypothetical protein SWY16_00360 [Cyanobacteriota bacterium]|nr:hypothetical protein [Cyanobacteriota bacterium]
MMKNKHLYLLISLPFFLELSFQSERQLPIALSIEPNASFEAVGGQILQIDGNLQIERDGRRITANPGTNVYPQDRLIATNGGQAIVQCLDNTLSVQSVTHHDRLLANCDTLAVPQPECEPGIVECTPRGDELLWSQTNIPYIISPHRTRLLDPAPIFRWNAVGENVKYQVSLLENGREIWTSGDEPISATEIQYTQGNLKVGKNYSLEVYTTDGYSSFETPQLPAEMGVTLLEETEAAAVRQLESQIQTSSIEESAKALAVAQLYLDRMLVAEALFKLESVVDGGMENSAIYRRIGGIYWRYLGIAPDAKNYYDRALDRVEDINLEEKTEILSELGTVEASLGNSSRAIELLTEARTGYMSLGNLDKAEELKVQIERLD